MIDVNSYEMARSYRKSSMHLILSREEREALLLNWGASFHDIVEAVRGNIRVKNQRRQTVTNLGRTEKIEEAFESATRKLKRALLLRRSTGNKVKRLQEQADLAQRALASLKIVEDRALSEIHRGRSPSQEGPEKDDLDNYNLDVTVSNYGRSAPLDSNVRRSSHMSLPHMIMSEEEDYYGSFDCFTLGGNSTTPSQLEMERFYRELELEMFGDEELPSMVGQTLEVPAGVTNGCFEISDSNINLDDSLNSGLRASPVDLFRLWNERRQSSISAASPLTGAESKDEATCDDLDAALELEQNQSMISRSLLEDEEFASTRGDATNDQRDRDALYHYRRERMYPVHGDYFTSRYHSATSRLSSSLDSADPERGRLIESVVAMEYQFLQSQQHHQQHHPPAPPPPLQLVPSHAGTCMFQDCTFLDVHSASLPSYSDRNGYSLREDSDAGPRIQHFPPPCHFSLSRWMEGIDSSSITLEQGYQTITICEEFDLWDGRLQGDMNSDRRGGTRFVASQKFPSCCY
jgi:transcriptional regulator with XRE-family HTH domain